MERIEIPVGHDMRVITEQEMREMQKDLLNGYVNTEQRLLLDAILSAIITGRLMLIQ